LNFQALDMRRKGVCRCAQKNTAVSPFRDTELELQPKVFVVAWSNDPAATAAVAFEHAVDDFPIVARRRGDSFPSVEIFAIEQRDPAHGSWLVLGVRRDKRH
jgi:hypothetical protein